MALLRADALGELQPLLQLGQRQGVVGGELRCCAPALHLAHDHAQDRALALDHALEVLELFGVALQAALGHRPNPSPGTNRPQDGLSPGSA